MHPLFFGTIPSYGAMAVFGIFAASIYIVLANGASPQKIQKADILHLLIVAAVAAVFGAKIMYVLTCLPSIAKNLPTIIKQPHLLIFLLTGGLVFYGGLFGGLFGVKVYCKKYGLQFGTVMDIFVPGLALFHVFGRIGCFLAGCCFGVPAFWGVAFKNSLHGPNGVALVPVQLIEAGFNAVLFGVLAVRAHKGIKSPPILMLYLICYSTIRFLLEFWRADTQRGVFLLSTGQWLSISILAACLFCIFKKGLLQRRQN